MNQKHEIILKSQNLIFTEGDANDGKPDAFRISKSEKSKFGWNFNIMDGLGWILKIFKQNHQKRPEAKVNLRNNDQRLEQPPVLQMAWKLCHYGWFGMDFENIQADPSKEARGQS